MRHHLTVALLATLATLTLAAPAHAYVLGAGDRPDGDAAASAALGARVYRVVIDPATPLATYDARITAHRNVGQRPQLVIGGTGTSRHASRTGITETAVAAFKRWPDTYSVSVVNEPNLSGMSVCGWIKTYRRSYKALHAAGAPRVLFGEFSPISIWDWTQAAITRCGGGPIKADGYAWHCYDASSSWTTLSLAAPIVQTNLRKYRKRIHTPRGFTPPMYCTEYGQPTRGTFQVADEQEAAQRWRNVLAAARKFHVAEVVAWDVHQTPEGSVWDSSLIEPDGQHRPAFAAIASAHR